MSITSVVFQPAGNEDIFQPGNVQCITS